MIKYFILIVVLALSSNITAQELKTIQIPIEPLLEQKQIVLDSTYQVNGEDLSIQTLKFYLSNFSFLNNQTTVFTPQNSFHLIDLEDSTSLYISFEIPDSIQYDQLSFNLGIDSLSNVSGVMGGDLDPMKGMYWSWNTGYINLKLEGNSPLCDNRDQSFQFHLGGYLAPFSNYQSLSFEIDNTDNLKLSIDLTELFNTVNLSSNHTTMSPSSEAIDLMKIITNNCSLYYAP